CIGSRVPDQADVRGELQRRYVVAAANIAIVLDKPDTMPAQLVGECAGKGEELRRSHRATSAARHPGKGCTLAKERRHAPFERGLLPMTVGHDDIVRQLVERGAVEQARGGAREALAA